jgi:hypothetical protein
MLQRAEKFTNFSAALGIQSITKHSALEEP